MNSRFVTVENQNDVSVEADENKFRNYNKHKVRTFYFSPDGSWQIKESVCAVGCSQEVLDILEIKIVDYNSDINQCDKISENQNKMNESKSNHEINKTQSERNSSWKISPIKKITKFRFKEFDPSQDIFETSTKDYSGCYSDSSSVSQTKVQQKKNCHAVETNKNEQVVNKFINNDEPEKFSQRKEDSASLVGKKRLPRTCIRSSPSKTPKFIVEDSTSELDPSQDIFVDKNSEFSSTFCSESSPRISGESGNEVENTHKIKFKKKKMKKKKKKEGEIFEIKPNIKLNCVENTMQDFFSPQKRHKVDDIVAENLTLLEDIVELSTSDETEMIGLENSQEKAKKKSTLSQEKSITFSNSEQTTNKKLTKSEPDKGTLIENSNKSEIKSKTNSSQQVEGHQVETSWALTTWKPSNVTTKVVPEEESEPQLIGPEAKSNISFNVSTNQKKGKLKKTLKDKKNSSFLATITDETKTKSEVITSPDKTKTQKVLKLTNCKEVHFTPYSEASFSLDEVTEVLDDEKSSEKHYEGNNNPNKREIIDNFIPKNNVGEHLSEENKNQISFKNMHELLSGDELSKSKSMVANVMKKIKTADEFELRNNSKEKHYSQEALTGKNIHEILSEDELKEKLSKVNTRPRKTESCSRVQSTTPRKRKICKDPTLMHVSKKKHTAKNAEDPVILGEINKVSINDKSIKEPSEENSSPLRRVVIDVFKLTNSFTEDSSEEVLDQTSLDKILGLLRDVELSGDESTYDTSTNKRKTVGEFVKKNCSKEKNVSELCDKSHELISGDKSTESESEENASPSKWIKYSGSKVEISKKGHLCINQTSCDEVNELLRGNELKENKSKENTSLRIKRKNMESKQKNSKKEHNETKMLSDEIHDIASDDELGKTVSIVENAGVCDQSTLEEHYRREDDSDKLKEHHKKQIHISNVSINKKEKRKKEHSKNKMLSDEIHDIGSDDELSETVSIFDNAGDCDQSNLEEHCRKEDNSDKLKANQKEKIHISDVSTNKSFKSKKELIENKILIDKIHDIASDNDIGETVSLVKDVGDSSQSSLEKQNKKKGDSDKLKAHQEEKIHMSDVSINKKVKSRIEHSKNKMLNDEIHDIGGSDDELSEAVSIVENAGDCDQSTLEEHCRKEDNSDKLKANVKEKNHLSDVSTNKKDKSKKELNENKILIDKIHEIASYNELGEAVSIVENVGDSSQSFLEEHYRKKYDIVKLKAHQKEKIHMSDVSTNKIRPSSRSAKKNKKFKKASPKKVIKKYNVPYLDNDLFSNGSGSDSEWIPSNSDSGSTTKSEKNSRVVKKLKSPSKKHKSLNKPMFQDSKKYNFFSSTPARKEGLESFSQEDDFSPRCGKLNTISNENSSTVDQTILDDIQCKMIASRSELKALKRLRIKVDWELSPLHKIDTGSCRVNTTMIKQKLGSEHSRLVNESKFTLEDESKIKQSWEEFAQKYNFENPTIFFPSKQNFGCFSIKERHNFKLFLAKYLPDRRLLSVYKKFLDIYGSKRKGRWSDKEDRLLLDLYFTCKEDVSNVEESIDGSQKQMLLGLSMKTLMARALDRTLNSVDARLKTLLANENVRNIMQKDIEWTLELEGEVVHRLIKKSKVDSLEDLRYATINYEVWRKVVSKFDLPIEKVIDHWKYNLYPQLFARQPVLRHILCKQLIKWLFKSDIKSHEAIDWKDLSKRAGDLGWCYLYRVFRNMVGNFVPKEFRYNFIECIAYLYDSYLPKLREKTTSHMLNRKIYDPETRTLKIREEDEAGCPPFRIK